MAISAWHSFVTIVITLTYCCVFGAASGGNKKWGFRFIERHGFSIGSDEAEWFVATLPGDLNVDNYITCDLRQGDLDLCVVWPRYGKIEVKDDLSEGVACSTINIESLSLDFTPRTCFPVGDSSWYGAAELHGQRWPLNHVTLPLQAHVPNDLYPLPFSYGNVAERYWINSDGVGITVDNSIPLFSSFNESGTNEICFESRYMQPYLHIYNKYPQLKFVVCKSDNVKSIHTFMSRSYFDRPSGIPDERMIKSPVWSTWARYKTAVDQKKVLEYANEIRQHAFSNSQIEIDDMFSTHYGEFNFNSTKFPTPLEMVRELKEKDFRVTIWVTPFANLDAPAFKEGMEKGYWLRDQSYSVPALVKWWQGVGGILDVSNNEAVEWYLGRLEKMKDDFEIDSFKFDAGEITFLPSSYRPLSPWENPAEYARGYVDAVSRKGPLIEVRCGFQTQKYPVFVRMGDKDSRWDYKNGLKTLIPATLTLGLLGYPYILPDMIGGNGYGDDPFSPFTETLVPDRELFIRWLEVTAYLPAMQFSFVPWQYDDEVVTIARKYVQIHEDVVTPILLKVTEEAQNLGNPLIRPLWWIAPEDEFALTNDSEFLVGDELLVAPILDKGARMRDIYLPQGKWMDELKGGGLAGGRWLRNYKVDIGEIATFKKIK